MYTLDINAAYHDPAAVLVKDGQVIAAAEEERFSAESIPNAVEVDGPPLGERLWLRDSRRAVDQ